MDALHYIFVLQSQDKQRLEQIQEEMLQVQVRALRRMIVQIK